MRQAHFRYEIIAEDLRQNILAGRPPVGGRLPSEPELARAYGVNHQTLRKALALLEAEGLLDRRRGRGTFVLPLSPATTSTEPETVLFAGRTFGHLHQELFQAVVAAVQETGRSVFPFQLEADNPPEAVERVRRLLSVGGPVLVAEGGRAALAKRFPEAPATLVQVGFLDESWPPQPGYHAVSDVQRAGLLATRHLLALGHRRLAFVGAHPEDKAPDNALPTVKTTHPAYEGFRLALAEANVSEHRSLGYYHIGVDHCGVDIASRFLEKLDGWATGFVCDADFRAVTLDQALRECGLRIPHDVSVVGMGNTPWCQAVGDGLDSVDFEIEALARLALSLTACPAHPERPLVFHVKPRLVTRASSAAPARPPSIRQGVFPPAVAAAKVGTPSSAAAAESVCFRGVDSAPIPQRNSAHLRKAPAATGIPTHDKEKSNRTRFTLIELLVVVAIIAILASLLLPHLDGAMPAGVNLVTVDGAGRWVPRSECTTDGGNNAGVWQYWGGARNLVPKDYDIFYNPWPAGPPSFAQVNIYGNRSANGRDVGMETDGVGNYGYRSPGL